MFPSSNQPRTEERTGSGRGGGGGGSGACNVDIHIKWQINS